MKKIIILPFLILIIAGAVCLFFNRTSHNVAGMEVIKITHGKEDSFWIGKYEVTQKQYEEIMGNNPSKFKENTYNPVETVNRYDAIEFCNKLSLKAGRTPYYERYINDSSIILFKQDADGFRLPTSEEWEFAARAGVSTEYFWGDEVDGNYAWYSENSGGRTHPVGTRMPNVWGLYDMCGNVAEMCWGDASGEGKLSLAQCGGNWQSSSLFIRINSVIYLPDLKFDTKGFRVVINDARSSRVRYENNPDEKKYKIGERGPGGGWIFYNKGNSSGGWRYLEVAPLDQSRDAIWSPYIEQLPNAKGVSIGTGKSNTQAIIKSIKNSPVVNIAVKKCIEYRGGGKDDWFLPSRDELNELKKTLYNLGVGGLNGNYEYWTSTEIDEHYAFSQVFAGGFQMHEYKRTPKRVRAIRAF